MEINVNTKTVYTNEKVFENSSDNLIEFDVTLPDYCPDIKKILKCSVSPKLVSSRCTGDRVNVEANAVVRVIYSSEDNRVFCYEKTVPISKTFDIGTQAENPCVHVKMKTSYVNVRVHSARRIDVNSSIAVEVKVTLKKEHQVVYDAENAGIQLLKDCMGVSSFVGETLMNFGLSETVEINEGKAPVLEILRVSSSVSDVETKAVNNKMLVKGNLKVTVLYVTDNEEKRPQIFEHTMPISRIIELEGISDNTDNFVSLSTNGVEIGVKTNGSGERRLIDIDAGVVADIRSSQRIDSELPTDCFSTKYELNVSTTPVNFETRAEKICDNISIKSNEKINGIKIGEIYDVWCDSVKKSAKYNDGEITVSGEINASILGKDESGIPFYAERTVDFEKKFPTEKCDDAIFDVECDVNSIDIRYIIGGEDSIELRIEAVLCADVFRTVTTKLISSIEIDENNCKRSKSMFTVYFADEGETLWDIARQFNTTVDSIRQENDSSVLASQTRRMLFIPTV